jgi:hypothetical protein
MKHVSFMPEYNALLVSTLAGKTVPATIDASRDNLLTAVDTGWCVARRRITFYETTEKHIDMRKELID